MADYSGSWYKGFASTFSQAPSMVLNVLALKEKKKAQKKIDDAIEELKLNSSTLAAKFDAARADGTIGQEEYGDMAAWALPLGNEIMGRLDTLTNNYRNLSQDQIDNEIADIKAFYELSVDLDFQNIEEMEAFGNGLTQQNAKTKWDLILKSVKKRKEPLQPDVFASPEEVMAKYPGSGYKFDANAGGYIPTYQEPPTTELSVADKKYNWAIDNYKEGKISFEQLSKFMGTDISDPEKRNTIQQRLDEMVRLGATPEEQKNYLLGKTTGEEGTPAPTSTENIRDDILQAPTLNDAHRIYKNFDDKYDIKALGIPDVDKFWSDERVRRLDSLKTSIENLLVDRGDKGRWLKPGTVTSAEVGMEIEGDEQEVAIAYRDLRDEYMRFRDMLEKMGVDVSQYPKLKPLSEIEKVGGWEGAVGWGVKGVGFGIKKGDYKSIYY